MNIFIRHDGVTHCFKDGEILEDEGMVRNILLKKGSIVELVWNDNNRRMVKIDEVGTMSTDSVKDIPTITKSKLVKYKEVLKYQTDKRRPAIPEIKIL